MTKAKREKSFRCKSSDNDENESSFPFSQVVLRKKRVERCRNFGMTFRPLLGEHKLCAVDLTRFGKSKLERVSLGLLIIPRMKICKTRLVRYLFWRRHKSKSKASLLKDVFRYLQFMKKSETTFGRRQTNKSFETSWIISHDVWAFIKQKSLEFRGCFLVFLASTSIKNDWTRQVSFHKPYPGCTNWVDIVISWFYDWKRHKAIKHRRLVNTSTNNQTERRLWVSTQSEPNLNKKFEWFSSVLECRMYTLHRSPME